jgi:hypothetical protein
MGIGIALLDLNIGIALIISTGIFCVSAMVTIISCTSIICGIKYVDLENKKKQKEVLKEQIREQMRTQRNSGSSNSSNNDED